MAPKKKSAVSVAHMATTNTRGDVERVFGWQRQLPDHRDVVVNLKLAQAVVGSLPHKFDMRPEVTNVYDQGNLGSCTANAALGAVIFTEDEETGKARPPMSRLFTYYYTRKLQGTVNHDSGATLRGVFKSLNLYGYCFEKLWPYDVAKFKTQPPMAVGTDAKKHCLRVSVDYQAVPQTEVALKTVLAAHNPIAFGFSVYESFMSQIVAKTGVVPMPLKNESMVGGHAVLLVGYDDDKQCYLVLNSWGKKWGEGGFFYMPYKYIHNKNLASDFWTATGTPAVEAE